MIAFVDGVVIQAGRDAVLAVNDGAVGLIVTPKNAWKLLVVSSLGIAASSGLFVLFPGMKAIYVR